VKDNAALLKISSEIRLAMTRILITSGPTREYLDPVRYLSNGSSGRMGQALAQAALDAGCEVVVVSGPVTVTYPAAAEVIPVVSTQDLLLACREHFPHCDGLIAAAAPCDFRPRQVAEQKIKKTGAPLRLELEETPDVLADLARLKEHRWVMGFALETEDPLNRGLSKLQKKKCDWIVVNGPGAMHSVATHFQVLDPTGQVVLPFAGTKEAGAAALLQLIFQKFPPGARS